MLICFKCFNVRIGCVFEIISVTCVVAVVIWIVLLEFGFNSFCCSHFIENIQFVLFIVHLSHERAFKVPLSSLCLRLPPCGQIKAVIRSLKICACLYNVANSPAISLLWRWKFSFYPRCLKGVDSTWRYIFWRCSSCCITHTYTFYI